MLHCNMYPDARLQCTTTVESTLWGGRYFSIISVLTESRISYSRRSLVCLGVDRRPGAGDGPGADPDDDASLTWLAMAAGLALIDVPGHQHSSTVG